MSEVVTKGKLAKQASYKLMNVTTEEKNKALLFIAEQIVEDQETILTANENDLANGKESGLDPSVLDRIMLNEERINQMAHAIKLLTGLKDPIGTVVESNQLDNGMLV